MTVDIRVGDWLEHLASFGPDSYQMICTSPPYYGLRDYQVAGQLGLERTPDEYVAKIVAGMALARRGLAKDGTLWLNLGDSYCAAPKGSLNGQDKSGLTSTRTQQAAPAKGLDKRRPRIGKTAKAGQGFADVADVADVADAPHRRAPLAGLKSKDLIGVPWMVAFALRADGWFLRSDVIWAKKNGMPESVKDRPTRSHEYVFLLSKSAKYFYDWKAVRTPLSASSLSRLEQPTLEQPTLEQPTLEQPTLEQQNGSHRANGKTRADRPMKAVKFGGNKRMGGAENMENLGGYRERERERERESSAATARGRAMSGARPGAGFDEGASLRDVWHLATQPFAEAHFAVMPPKLAETCILAGSRPGDTVLDPFFGAGTTGLVADRLGRNCLGIELNPEYAALARERIRRDAPLFAAGGL